MPSQEELNRLLTYNPYTGELIAKVCRGKIHAGEIVGSRTSTGYSQTSVNNRRVLTHRLIWTLLYGPIPKGMVIDHINGNRRDNRLSNLRLASHQTNCRNSVRHKHNKSGVMGVYFIARSGRWRATINNMDRTIHLGHFKTFEEAVARRKQAEVELGFHPNHGRAA